MPSTVPISLHLPQPEILAAAQSTKELYTLAGSTAVNLQKLLQASAKAKTKVDRACERLEGAPGAAVAAELGWRNGR